MMRSPIMRVQIKRKSRKKKQGDDPKYMAYIRTLPCVVCWKAYFESGFQPVTFAAEDRGRQTTRTEVAHVGVRGIGQKAFDRFTLPMCSSHHRTGKFAHHVMGRNFFTYHGLDRDALVNELNRRYDAKETE